jgi:hypothetical protein
MMLRGSIRLAAGLGVLGLSQIAEAQALPPLMAPAHQCIAVDLAWRGSKRSGHRNIDVRAGEKFQIAAGRSSAQIAIDAEITKPEPDRFHARGTLKFRNSHGKLQVLALDQELPYTIDLPGGRGARSRVSIVAKASSPQLATLGYWAADESGWEWRGPDLLPLRSRRMPTYPEYALRTGMTGEVMLRILVSPLAACRTLNMRCVV